MTGRSGFTLVELLAALLVSAVAVSVAAGVFTNMADAVEATRRRAAAAERRAAGMLWLQQAALAADVSTDSGGTFQGTADTLRLRTSMPVARGWVEPMRVVVYVRQGRLVLVTPEATYALTDSLAYAAFDYLADYGERSVWLREWDSPVRPPRAVRVRWGLASADADADTVLLYVGRGS